MLSFNVNEKSISEAFVGDVLISLGEESPKHARPNASEELIKQGFELVHLGRTTGPNGKQSKYISKYYVCTSCHNTSIEDPDLSKADPEARLDYVDENSMKFLPGSPLYGIANRESWYNGDYYKKYGDLVDKARNSLAESTQLCAKVCSSGRYLEDWELEAILAYYWSTQLKVSDLGLSEVELGKIVGGDLENKEKVALIKSKYLQDSPATFGDLPQRMDLGYPFEGNPEKGKKIYELSCQTCHSEGGVSGMVLDQSKVTFQKFKKNLLKNTDYNLYQIIRHGTYAESGKPRYMPLYTKEKLSDQQVEDLKAFILSKAN